MRILFLHPNFPGQFRGPAHWLSKNHDVVFLCQTHYGRTLPNVKTITLKGPLGIDHLDSLSLDSAARSAKLSSQYLRGFAALREKGWIPDIVISHTGWGCGLHSKSLFPEAAHIAYVEWWFNQHQAISSRTANKLYPHEQIQRIESSSSRNSLISLELANSDCIVAPTDWQKRQLPSMFRNLCTTIYDGVDLNRFARPPHPDLPLNFGTDDFLVTYGTRGMEPVRGFPDFIRAIPPLLNKYPNARVSIAGEDEICYGGKPPVEGSYGKWAQKYLSKWIASSRVEFVGRLPPDRYVSWLHSSSLHVYLTQPYVASWSLLEAMAAGCLIAASDTPPVREFLPKCGGLLTDHKGDHWLLDIVGSLASGAVASSACRCSALSRARDFDSRSSREKWLRLLSGFAVNRA